MIDLDDFKQINDRFGHSVGDAALVDTANILRSAAGSRTVVIRFAGDEFIVLEKTDAPGALEAAERRIREELARFNAESGKPYRLGFFMEKRCNLFREG